MLIQTAATSMDRQGRRANWQLNSSVLSELNLRISPSPPIRGLFVCTVMNRILLKAKQTHRHEGGSFFEPPKDKCQTLVLYIATK